MVLVGRVASGKRELVSGRKFATNFFLTLNDEIIFVISLPFLNCHNIVACMFTRHLIKTLAIKNSAEIAELKIL